MPGPVLARGVGWGVSSPPPPLPVPSLWGSAPAPARGLRPHTPRGAPPLHPAKGRRSQTPARLHSGPRQGAPPHTRGSAPDSLGAAPQTPPGALPPDSLRAPPPTPPNDATFRLPQGSAPDPAERRHLRTPSGLRPRPRRTTPPPDSLWAAPDPARGSDPHTGLRPCAPPNGVAPRRLRGSASEPGVGRRLRTPMGLRPGSREGAAPLHSGKRRRPRAPSAQRPSPRGSAPVGRRRGRSRSSVGCVLVAAPVPRETTPRRAVSWGVCWGWVSGAGVWLRSRVRALPV